MQLLGLSHFPWQLGQRGAVISLLALAKGCQHGRKAVTPRGPAMPQQMEPQHHGRGNLWVDVCWGVGDGSWVGARSQLRAWASLQLREGALKPLWAPFGTQHWGQLPTSPAELCPWVSPDPILPLSFQIPRDWGSFPVPLCVRPSPCLPGRAAPGKHGMYFQPVFMCCSSGGAGGEARAMCRASFPPAVAQCLAMVENGAW